MTLLCTLLPLPPFFLLLPTSSCSLGGNRSFSSVKCCLNGLKYVWMVGWIYWVFTVRTALANVYVCVCVCVAKHLVEWEFSSLSFATRRLRRKFPCCFPLSAPAALRGYSLGICFVRAVAKATRLAGTRKEWKWLTRICTRNESERTLLAGRGEGKEFVALLTIFSYYF